MPAGHSDKVKRVFISYSHDSDEHLDLVIDLANRLREDGVNCWIDQFEQAPPESWPVWAERQIKKADHVLLVCTAQYLAGFQGTAPYGERRGVKWEGAIIDQTLYESEGGSTKFIPLILRDEDLECIPLTLRGATRYTYSASDNAAYEAVFRHITHQPKIKPAELGPLRKLSPLPRLQQFPSQPKKATGASGEAEAHAIDHRSNGRSAWADVCDRLRADVFDIADWCHDDPDFEEVMLAIKAVRHGVNRDSSQRFRHRDNLQKFVELLEDFVKHCIERVPAETTREDVASLFAAVKLDLNQTVASSVRGEAMDELVRANQKIMREILKLLQDSLRRDQVPQREDVEQAFSAAIDRVWKHEHRSSRNLQAGALWIVGVSTVAILGVGISHFVNGVRQLGTLDISAGIALTVLGGVSGLLLLLSMRGRFRY